MLALLLVHPGFKVLTSLLTSSPLQSIILSYMVGGIKGFKHHLLSEKPYFLWLIILVLCIIYQVLKIQNMSLAMFNSAPLVENVHSGSFYTWFNQVVIYRIKCISVIAMYIIYPSCLELVLLTVKMISSLLALTKCSTNSKHILSGFRFSEELSYHAHARLTDCP